LLRYYAGYADFLDPRRMEDLDRIVEALDATIEEVVVDLAAQTEANLEEWLVAGDVIPLLARLGYPLWYWYVIDDGKDSVRLLEALLDRLDPSVHVVCVKNQGCGRDFMLFEEAKLGSRIAQRGGDVIELPALHAGSMLKMDAYDKSFWAAIHNEDPEEGPCLGRMERERAKVFIRHAHDAFRQILDPATDAG
jgi:hypothetical protein